MKIIKRVGVVLSLALLAMSLPMIVAADGSETSGAAGTGDGGQFVNGDIINGNEPEVEKLHELAFSLAPGESHFLKSGLVLREPKTVTIQAFAGAPGLKPDTVFAQAVAVTGGKSQPFGYLKFDPILPLTPIGCVGSVTADLEQGTYDITITNHSSLTVGFVAATVSY